ncbi:hypothetical protein A2334_06230 [Candidatus Roizmanbacteria bacterium RIFOXYB2_FULL_38_10]|uniref:Uncharacterized protein n=1 Tax=Candidatus Roizmanbacteria bacterium RIFOXYD1_FULL_38_12 TaxID=1802093 RepID=A0A1F7L206_9BACT|nr:MAG: hypothetical protein A3K47_05230 [Candidatus Roizmanbacteria bacterium RIFOXYA2_FULL_38_14]OGK64148.1 MAG: hypothetical protein A3K27_05230 [Candidatus Roizmanbacteria bacterium RIFOXYA1_FULL_37_12]OGK65994.1 MAG: hypothetical protein A3K38_05230 [Candidatus Roizmanbacteria bacterium RIFOXYB1_FULL_40_23]OGK68441.1 MAG: hypothetical protein A2334_06230 [Candidatus Roizmanbacteria bacterium RIFOXYB2_FULL_38_10]OGK70399.1 MAG: hypothetical protein A3K21_05235 [Candidatus Roizmanbacteria ba
MTEENVAIGKKELRCLYCGNNTFIKAKTLLNRRFFAIFDLEVFNMMTKRGLGIAYICTKCGYKHEFFKDMPKDRGERVKEMFQIP